MREKDSKKPAFLMGNVGQMKNSGSDSALNLEKHMKKLSEKALEVLAENDLTVAELKAIYPIILKNWREFDHIEDMPDYQILNWVLGEDLDTLDCCIEKTENEVFINYNWIDDMAEAYKDEFRNG